MACKWITFSIDFFNSRKAAQEDIILGICFGNDVTLVAFLVNKQLSVRAVSWFKF